MPKTYQFDHLLSADGWLSPSCVTVEDDGMISAVSKDPDSTAEKLSGACVPGMPNLHSHAFQRAMAGLTEIGGGTENNFWSWQKVMYDFLAALGPEDVEAIAAQLYVEMLKGGYTSVGEFHYLHHGPGGKTYSDPKEMSNRIFSAASQTGIALTHLPVLYAQGGFGGQPPLDGQKRFLHDIDSFARLVTELQARCRSLPGTETGMAFHSLRAVSPEMMSEILKFITDGPVHIHIAEQMREVTQCVEWSRQRPVEWLFEKQHIDNRWCLVHATHMTEEEIASLAKSGAVVGLCPSTEANLGDGLFSLPGYIDQGGVFGLGSDSNTSVDAADEIRLLEYGQRLHLQQRNISAAGDGLSTGASLFQSALQGGAIALAQPVGSLKTGVRADMIILNTDHPVLAGRSGDAILDTWIFAGGRAVIKDVFAAGHRVVCEGRHWDEDRIANTYRQAICRLGY